MSKQRRKVCHVLAEASGWSYPKVKEWLYHAANESPAAENMTRLLVRAIAEGTAAAQVGYSGTRPEVMLVDEFYARRPLPPRWKQ